ncbi:MAG: hypothetical protein P4N59_32635 [Negativicutes bacterium]|nr:hypothetical protein [Negativicutes bacterium]
MFQRLMDYQFKRDYTQAAGFYIAYALVGVILGLLSGLIAGQVDVQYAQQAGAVVGLIYVVALYGFICIKKNLDSKVHIVVGLLTALLNLFCGTFVSLALVAFLTTRESRSKPDLKLPRLDDENI